MYLSKRTVLPGLQQVRAWRLLLPTLLVLLLLTVTAGSTFATHDTPTIDVIAVLRDDSVTIETNNFPANRTFTARMGAMGTRGVNGVVAGTLESGAGGELEATFDIPAQLQGSRLIAIRLEAPGGYFAYSWFHNNTTEFGAGTQPPAPTATTAPSQPIPTFDVIAVQRDTTVTIRTADFPANRQFTVRMGPMGTRGVDGVVAGTTDSGAGGTFDATYTIPQSLRGSSIISIRLESPSGHFAYNWFYNSTSR